MPVSPMNSTVAELSPTLREQRAGCSSSRATAVTTRSMPGLGLSLSRSSRFSASSSERCASTIATAALFASTASRFSSRCLNGAEQVVVEPVHVHQAHRLRREVERHAHQRADALERVGQRGAEARVGGHAAREQRAALGDARAPTASRCTRRMRRARSRPRPCWATTSSRPPPLAERHEAAVAAGVLDRELARSGASSPSMSEVSRNSRFASSSARNSLQVESETATYWRSSSRRSASARSSASAIAGLGAATARPARAATAPGRSARARSRAAPASAAPRRPAAPRRAGGTASPRACAASATGSSGTRSRTLGRQQQQALAPRRQRGGQLVGLAQALEALRRGADLGLERRRRCRARRRAAPARARRSPARCGRRAARPAPRRAAGAPAPRRVRPAASSASPRRVSSSATRSPCGRAAARVVERGLEQRERRRRRRRGRAPARRGTRAPAVASRSAPAWQRQLERAAEVLLGALELAAAAAQQAESPAAPRPRPAGGRSRARSCSDWRKFSSARSHCPRR